MKVGEIYQYKDEGGSVIAARVVSRPPRRITFVTRKNNRGAWSKKEQDMPLSQFRKLVNGGL